jgi:hypothetical protein
MKLSINSRFVGAVTAAAVTLTTFTAAPAFADDERTARAIAAILGLAVVGKIIHDNNKSRDHVTQHVYKEKPKVKKHKQHKTKKHRQSGQAGWYTQREFPAKPLPRRVSRKTLPQHCLRSFETRRGHIRMLPRRCLERNYSFVHRLPQHCGVRVRTERGPRMGYAARCLRQNGYRFGVS